MPGHNIPRRLFKDKEAYDRHLCIKCHLLLRDVVQPSCGHRLCMTCTDEILSDENPPLCPHDDCGEPFVKEDGIHYFPDRFIRREIQGLVLCCMFSEKGCDWEGKFSQLESHLKGCSYAILECELCGENMRADQLESHKAVCPNSLNACRNVNRGCQWSGYYSELKRHLKDREFDGECRKFQDKEQFFPPHIPSVVNTLRCSAGTDVVTYKVTSYDDADLVVVNKRQLEIAMDCMHYAYQAITNLKRSLHAVDLTSPDLERQRDTDEAHKDCEFDGESQKSQNKEQFLPSLIPTGVNTPQCSAGTDVVTYKVTESYDDADLVVVDKRQLEIAMDYIHYAYQAITILKRNLRAVDLTSPDSERQRDTDEAQKKSDSIHIACTASKTNVSNIGQTFSHPHQEGACSPRVSGDQCAAQESLPESHAQCLHDSQKILVLPVSFFMASYSRRDSESLEIIPQPGALESAIPESCGTAAVHKR